MIWGVGCRRGGLRGEGRGALLIVALGVVMVGLEVEGEVDGERWRVEVVRES